MRVRFDRFELDTDLRLLTDGQQKVHVSPKALRLLEILIEARPRPLSRQDLTEAIWADTFVEESNLAGLVAEIRGALGDDARHPRFIRTVHTHGYGFCGQVSSALRGASDAVLMVRGETVRLHDGENVVGRDAVCDVIVDDATISRRHARIVITDGTATIEDLGSKNGTFVDGEAVDAPLVLRDRQTITFGEVHVVFAATGPSAPTVTMRSL